MELIALFNNAPVLLIFVYLGIEAIKAFLTHRSKLKQTKSDERSDLTKSVFDLYSMAREDLDTEKHEIRELTKALKRANIEIAILERKVAALMRVLDTALAIPEISKKYIDSMQQFDQEASTITDRVIMEEDRNE